MRILQHIPLCRMQCKHYLFSGSTIVRIVPADTRAMIAALYLIRHNCIEQQTYYDLIDILVSFSIFVLRLVY